MFDLMKPPAELRIKIYEYALVRDVIGIVTTAHPFGALHPRYNKRVQVYYEEPNPTKSVIMRSRWTSYGNADVLRRKDLRNFKIIAGEVLGDEIPWSYAIQPDGYPLINIFLTNRKVYSET